MEVTYEKYLKKKWQVTVEFWTNIIFMIICYLLL